MAATFPPRLIRRRLVPRRFATRSRSLGSKRMTGGRESAWGASRRGAWMAAAVLVFRGAGLMVRRESVRAKPGDDVRKLVLAQADSLDAWLASLRQALASTTGVPSSDGPPPAVRSAFRRARAQYKHLEGVVEFYAPALA